MTTDDDASAEAELVPLLEAPDPAALRAALSTLHRTKRLGSVARHTRFQDVLERARDFAVSSTTEAARLTGFVFLARIRAALRPVKPALRRAIEVALEAPLPPLSLIDDPDDRLSVATTLAAVLPPWAAAYLATSIVLEEKAEKTREALAGALLQSATLATALGLLATAFREFAKTPASSPIIAVRRLRAVLCALRKRLALVETEAGQDLGAAVRGFLASPFAEAEPPQEIKLLKPLAEDALTLLHEIVRTQPSALADPDIYMAAAIAKAWLRGPLWAAFVSGSPSAKALARDLCSGIVLLGKQGLASEALSERLSDLAGGIDRSRVMLRDLGQRHSELSPDVRQWLESGGRVRDQSGALAFEESALVGADRHLAAALLSAERARIAGDSGGGGELKAATERLANDVRQLAAVRGVRIVGSIGETVPFSRHLHELVPGAGVVTKVRIVRPAVERRNVSGTTDVLVKALVEPVV
jgi:hypothetical protein